MLKFLQGHETAARTDTAGAELLSKGANFDTAHASQYPLSTSAEPYDSAKVLSSALTMADMPAAARQMSQAWSSNKHNTDTDYPAVPLLNLDGLAAGEAQSAAQLLAVHNLHKENDDRFDAITRALESDATYKPGSYGSITEGTFVAFVTATPAGAANMPFCVLYVHM